MLSIKEKQEKNKIKKSHKKILGKEIKKIYIIKKSKKITIKKYRPSLIKNNLKSNIEGWNWKNNNSISKKNLKIKKIKSSLIWK